MAMEGGKMVESERRAVNILQAGIREVVEWWIGDRFLRVSYSKNEKTVLGQLGSFDQKHMHVSRKEKEKVVGAKW